MLTEKDIDKYGKKHFSAIIAAISIPIPQRENSEKFPRERAYLGEFNSLAKANKTPVASDFEWDKFNSYPKRIQQNLRWIITSYFGTTEEFLALKPEMPNKLWLLLKEERERFEQYDAEQKEKRLAAQEDHRRGISEYQLLEQWSEQPPLCSFEGRVDWLKQHSPAPEFWHDTAIHWNWSSMDVLDYITSQPECDQATASYIFLKIMNNHTEFATFDTKESYVLFKNGTDSLCYEEKFTIAQNILTRWQEGFYTRRKAGFTQHQYENWHPLGSPRLLDYPEMQIQNQLKNKELAPFWQNIPEEIFAKPTIIDENFVAEHDPIAEKYGFEDGDLRYQFYYWKKHIRGIA